MWESSISSCSTARIKFGSYAEGDMYCEIRSTQGKKFEEAQIIDWTVQMCLAIYYMHERRILHSDLKPRTSS